MSVDTDHLVRLMCAVETVRDYGCVHTRRALERMVCEEQKRLRVIKAKEGLSTVEPIPR